MNSSLETLSFELTCSACPEQYDVFVIDSEGNKNQVAYVRLRHGYLRVDTPNCGGDTVLEEELSDKGIDGCFNNADERNFYIITKIVPALADSNAIDLTNIETVEVVQFDTKLFVMDLSSLIK